MTFKPRAAAAQQAFSLTEVMFAALIVGGVFVSLFVAISQGFAVIQTARENLRATQILQEEMEVLRVLNWDQITTNPPPWNFTAAFYPTGGTNQGVLYNGVVNITNSTSTASYAGDMKLITVSLSWKGGNITRNREMRTLVTRYGLHNYFLNP